MSLRRDHPRHATLPRIAGAAVVLCVMATLPAHAQQPESPSAIATRGDDAAVLNDRSGDPWKRKAAASSLLASAEPSAIRALLDALADDSGAGCREAVLSAVSEAWSPPARLFRPIVELAARPRQVDPASVMPAIAAYRTREAAGILISALSLKGTTSGPGTAAAAAAALQAMTGRDDLGTDYVGWSRWLTRYRDAGEAAWRDALAEGVWRRGQRMEAERRIAAGKLVAGYRQLYLALPSDPGADRARLLSRMIADPAPELRDLGLDIVSRELSAGKTLDGSIGDAVLALLRDGSPGVRERAAVLVMQLAPPHVEDIARAALQSETDPAAAAALLRAVARDPGPADLEPALSWLERSPQTSEQASCSLLLAYLAKARLSDDGKARTAAALRKLEPASLSPDGCRLLATVGEPEDRSRLAMLLGGPSDALRLAAAEALCQYPEHTRDILAAAANDKRLFEPAVRAVIKAGPDADSWDVLASTPSPDDDTRSRGLMDAAEAMTLPELVHAAQRHESDPERCELLLSRLAEMSVDPMPARAPSEPLLLVNGLVRLAQARLALKRPDQAMQALETLPQPLPPGADPVAIRTLRTVSLLWSNRLDRAEAEDAPVSAWMDGLEVALAEPHAPAVLRRIRARFSTLTSEESARLEALAARLPQAQGQASGGESGPSHKP